MKIQEVNESAIPTVDRKISLGEKTISAEKDTTEINYFFNSKQKKAWKRLSPRKQERFLKKAGRAQKSGIQADGADVPNKKEIEKMREDKRNKPEKEPSYLHRADEQEQKKNQTFKTTNLKESSGNGTVSRAGEGIQKAADKGANAGGPAVRVAVEAAKQAKKAADKFKEHLTSRAIQEKAERMKEENQERDTIAKMGKYTGAVVAIAMAPVITAATTTVSMLASAVLTVLSPVLIILMIVSAIFGVLTVLFGGVQMQEMQSGYFGAKYYWIEYETGKTDDSAFDTVLGDNGAAFGVQFDYRYTLQGFLQYCHESDMVRYHPFLPFLQVDKSTLKGNQALASAWHQVYAENKDDFIQKQKDFSNERYYLPAEARLKNAGIKIEERNEVCKGAVLSFVFQGCRMGIERAVTEAGITNSSSDEEFIKKLYQYRREQYSKFVSRYEKEEQTALGLLSGGTVIAGKGSLCNPCPEARVSSEFGPRPAPKPGASTNHRGRDYAAPSGTPIYASAEGTVKTVASNGIRGNYIVIDHGGGLETWYQHCTTVIVPQGGRVVKGQKIATVGSTGIVTGPHLHYEVHENGVPVDPRKYL